MKKNCKLMDLPVRDASKVKGGGIKKRRKAK
jgi:hypothetical protein